MAVVGSAEVRIVADTSGLKEQVRAALKALEGDSNKIGKDLADQMAAGFGDRSASNFIDLGARDGDLYATSFADRMSANLSARMPAMGRAIGDSLGVSVSDSASARINRMHERTDFTAVGKKAKEQIAAGMKGIEPPEPPSRRRGPRGADGDGGADAGKTFGEKFRDAFDKSMRNRRPAPFEDMIKGIASQFIELSAKAAMMTGVVSAVMSVVNALAALAVGAGHAAVGLAAAGNIFGAFLQGMMVMKSVFGGVGKAIGALDQAQKAAKETALELAERLLAQARARLNLRQAIIQEGRAQEDALKRIADAQRAYQQAIKNEKEAQEDLIEARDRAQEGIEDMRLSLEEASLNEERAVLNLKKAEKALRQARSGGNVNAIYEADLAYREQEFSLRKLQESNADLQKEAAKTFAEGVDGNDQVKDAQERVTDAALAVAEALRELQRAQEDAPLAIEDAALRVKEAALALQQALQPPNKTALDAVDDAMKDLSPAAQRFARYWQGTISPMLKGIRQAGQEEFFPGLQRGLDAMVKGGFFGAIRDMVVGTSKVLGDFSERMGRTLVESENLGSLNKIFESNTRILETLGRAATTLVKPLLQIGEALAPFAEKMATRWEAAATKFSAFMDKVSGNGDLDKFLAKAEERMLAIKEMFKAFGPGIKEVFIAAAPAFDTLVEGIRKMGDEWSKTFTADKKKELVDTFQQSADNALKLLDVVTDIGGWLFRLGGDENIGLIADAIKKVLPTLEQAATIAWEQIADDVVVLVGAIGGFLKAISESEALNVFFGIVTGILRVIGMIAGALASTDIGKFLIIAVTGFFGLMKAASLITGLMGGIINGARGSLASVREWKDVFFSDKGEGETKWKRFRDRFGTATADTKGADQVKQQARDMEAAANAGAGKVKDAGRVLGRNFGKGVADGIGDASEEVVTKTKELAQGALNALHQVWDEHSDSVETTESGENFVSGIVNALIAGTREVYAASRRLAQEMVNGLKSVSTAGIGTDAVETMAHDVTAASPALQSAVKTAADTADDTLATTAGKAKTHGHDMVNNLAKGASDQAPQVLNVSNAIASEAAKVTDKTAQKGGEVAGRNSSRAFVKENAGQLGNVGKVGAAAGRTMEENTKNNFKGKNIGKKIAQEGVEGVSLAAGPVVGGAALLGEAAEDALTSTISGKPGKWRRLLDSIKKISLPAALAAAGTVATVVSVGGMVAGGNIAGAAGSVADMTGLSQVTGALGVDFNQYLPTGTQAGYEQQPQQVDISMAQQNISNVSNSYSYSTDVNIAGSGNGMARGGLVHGLKQNQDSVRAMLMPGEYVLTKDMVRRLGPDSLEQLRLGRRDVVQDKDSNPSIVPREYADANRSVTAMGAALAGAASGLPDVRPQSLAADRRVSGMTRQGDTQMALVSPGEYVLTREMVGQIGLGRLEAMRKKLGRGGSASTEGVLQRFAYGGLVQGMDIPAWLLDPNSPWRHNRLNNIGFIPEWTAKEKERLLAILYGMEQYAYLKNDANKDLFEKALEDQINGAEPAEKKQKEALQAAMDLKKSQLAVMNYGLQPITDAATANFSPMLMGFGIADFMAMSQDVKYDTYGRVMSATGEDVEQAKVAANYIQLTAEFQAALKVAFDTALAARIKEQQQAAAAAVEAADAAAAAGANYDYNYDDYDTGDTGDTGADPNAGVPADVLAPMPNMASVGKPSTSHMYVSGDKAKKMKNLFRPNEKWLFPTKNYPTGGTGATWKMHQPVDALDFKVPAGGIVRAINVGVISHLVKGDPEWGNWMAIWHHPAEDQPFSYYAHLREISKHGGQFGIGSHEWRVGDVVERDDKIALTGETGRATGNVDNVDAPGRPPGYNFHFRMRPNQGGYTGTLRAMKSKAINVAAKEWRWIKDSKTGEWKFGQMGTYLAKGGTVRATPGGISAVIGEAGRDERVTPLDSGGRTPAENELIDMVTQLLQKKGSGTVEVVNHIYPAPGMDERALAEQISREIMFARKIS
jgi:hypothetical protein